MTIWTGKIQVSQALGAILVGESMRRDNCRHSITLSNLWFFLGNHGQIPREKHGEACYRVVLKKCSITGILGAENTVLLGLRLYAFPTYSYPSAVVLWSIAEENLAPQLGDRNSIYG